jgi:hypothetical protein
MLSARTSHDPQPLTEEEGGLEQAIVATGTGPVMFSVVRLVAMVPSRAADKSALGLWEMLSITSSAFELSTELTLSSSIADEEDWSGSSGSLVFVVLSVAPQSTC